MIKLPLQLPCKISGYSDHRYYTEGIGNGSRAAIHCIILALGRQCSIKINTFLVTTLLVLELFRRATIFV